MPVLAQGIALRLREPTLLVENRLEAGSWRFRLTVVDDTGNESAPAELVVQVAARTTPPGPTRPDIVARPTDQPVVRQPITPPVTPVTPVRRPG